MRRLVINLISWGIYSAITFLLLIAPSKDFGLSIFSSICLSLLVGFLFGILNNIGRQLTIINDYTDYMPIPGAHLLNFNSKLRKKTNKELKLWDIITVYWWSIFSRKKFKHYVLCLVYSHTPIDSIRETKFVGHDKIVDRVFRKHIGELRYLKK